MDKITLDYIETKEKLIEVRNEAIKQINDNLFLREKWGFIDRLIAKVTGIKLPPTPKQQAISNIYYLFYKSLKNLDRSLNIKRNGHTN